MNRLTAIEIHTNGDDIKCSAGGPDKDGKYVGWIELWRDGVLHKTLLSTTPYFDNSQDAEMFMVSLVNKIRSQTLEAICSGS